MPTALKPLGSSLRAEEARGAWEAERAPEESQVAEEAPQEAEVVPSRGSRMGREEDAAVASRPSSSLNEVAEEAVESVRRWALPFLN